MYLYQLQAREIQMPVDRPAQPDPNEWSDGWHAIPCFHPKTSLSDWVASLSTPSIDGITRELGRRPSRWENTFGIGLKMSRPGLMGAKLDPAPRRDGQPGHRSGAPAWRLSALWHQG